MAFLVKLPPLGEGIFEAQMVAVHKQVGDRVKEGDVIAEMETDKATGALASPVDGVIEKFYIELGDYIFRNEKVLLIDDGKSDLRTGAGGDAGRVAEDGQIVQASADEKLAPAPENDQAKLASNEAVTEETSGIPSDQAEKEDQEEVSPAEAADDGDYLIVEETGSAAEIFQRVHGQQPKEKVQAPQVDKTFMAEQGQAQQGEPKAASQRKQRYLEPLQTNFMHSEDGSQPIPVHVANELPKEELEKRAETVKAAPAVRQYAVANHLDLSRLPVNEDGIVTKEMVDMALDHAVGEREWNYRWINELDPGYWTHRPDEEQGREETYIRKYNASRFEMTHHKVPPFSVQVKVDMTELRTYLKIQKGDRLGKQDYLPYFIKALCIAAHRYPELNASIDDVVSVFRFKSYVNVGIEMNTVQGLFTPVVKDAQDMSLAQIEKRLAELEYEVKKERIFNYETNSESTITLTDLSEYGPVDGFVPIIHYPDAAILGLAASQDEVVVREGEMVVRPLKAMTLVVDARIVTRDKIVRIINFIKDMIEKPSLLFQMEAELLEGDHANDA
ncbi:2-oxo acid dehydrogenase subunit E2 [Aerococcus sp. UMB7834]|uniref:2-oxo acid dehydrogenase subunit E2 n=2 Tax=Lactobacillales TaxID=186826 RepID=UPI00254BBB2D|nr:2-oxo acid dehydrogenase subunit E2 [Aerococcus sp. UMB7834]MDK6805823.1 2-oxo acid dehydrogenase subunit E2 [Aerococcus sp. UMB7834]